MIAANGARGARVPSCDEPGMVLDILEDHETRGEGAERPARLDCDRNRRMVRTAGPSDSCNQIVQVLFAGAVGHLARAMHQRGGHQQSMGHRTDNALPSRSPERRRAGHRGAAVLVIPRLWSGLELHAAIAVMDEELNRIRAARGEGPQVGQSLSKSRMVVEEGGAVVTLPSPVGRLDRPIEPRHRPSLKPAST